MSSLASSIKPSRTESAVLSQVETAIAAEPPKYSLKRVVQLLKVDSDHYDWVGIYLVEDNSLVLAAYAGDDETEHVRIPIGQGICGLAAKQGSTIVVADVNKDARYLMCFPSTRSEIVVPIKIGSRVLGEIDIDSDRIDAFSQRDRETLEAVASVLAGSLERQR